MKTKLPIIAKMAMTVPKHAIKAPQKIINPSRFSSPKDITEIPSAGIALVNGNGIATASEAMMHTKPTNCSQ